MLIINGLEKIFFLFGLLICAIALLLWSGLGRRWLDHLPDCQPRADRLGVAAAEIKQGF
jgi:hypothetical protein